MPIITAVAVAAVFAAAGALAVAHWSTGRSATGATVSLAAPALALPNPVWTSVPWPFPADPWGRGKAFRCDARHCGTAVVLYLRAKIGLCGCITAIDDDGVESGSDLDLLAPERTSLGPGRPIEVRWMKGRSRTYALGGSAATATSAVAVAFHERCDMIVATAAVGDGHAVRQEAAVIEFLNSDVVLRWAEVTLGL